MTEQTVNIPRVGDYVVDVGAKVDFRRVLVHLPPKTIADWNAASNAPVSAFNPEHDPREPVAITALEAELEETPGWRNLQPGELWRHVCENDIQYYSCPLSRLKSTGVAVASVDVSFDGSGRREFRDWGTYGYVVFHQGQLVEAESGVVERDRDNVSTYMAEYAGMVNGIEAAAAKFPDKRILIRGDCKKAIDEVERDVVPDEPALQEWWQRARRRLDDLTASVVYVPRERNERAHTLAYSEFLRQMAQR